MTKRHFKRLALALVAFRRAEGSTLAPTQYDALVDQVALACSEFNPEFSYGKFKDACEEPFVI